MKIRKRIVTEIAYNYVITDFLDDPRTIGLMNMLLGEKVPLTFVDKETKKIFIKPNTKLTHRILADLVMRWETGNKWYVTSNVFTREEMYNVKTNLMTILEPNPQAMQGPN